MSDFLLGVSRSIYQSSALPTLVMDYLFHHGVLQQTSQACIVDLIPPTFAGITALTIESGSQFRAKWAAGTDVSLPVRYEVYIRPDTSSGLFNTANIIAITDRLQFDIFTLPDSSFLVAGSTYYVGVRAIDAVGNRNTNTAMLSAISPGISVTGVPYVCRGSFSVDEHHKLRGTLWGQRNAVIMKGSLLGLASYEIYDRDGNLVPGLTEIGIVADPTTGQFVITPIDIDGFLPKPLDQYLVKVSITMDGVIRSTYEPLLREATIYEAKAQFSIDALNRFQGTLWAHSNGVVTTNLGTASYAVFDALGIAVPGLTQSGMTPDVNGRYQITPSSASALVDLTHYSVRVGIVVEDVERVSYRGFSLLGS